MTVDSSREVTKVRWPMQPPRLGDSLQTVLVGAVALVVAAAFVVVAAGCDSSSSSPAKVAEAAGASSCDNSGYYLIIKTTGEKETIYDCSFPSGQKCVTYANGIANDSTQTVRIVFSTALGQKQPSCLL